MSSTDELSKEMGLWLIALGCFSVLMGCFEYYQIGKSILTEYGIRFKRYPLIIAFFVAGMGLILFFKILIEI